jgi:hypothetical protein
MATVLRSAVARLRLLAAGTLVLLAGSGGAIPATSGAAFASSPATAAGAPDAPVRAASTAEVEPDQPVALAISGDAHLYIGDRGRNEILGWTPSGGFRVVAGTGRAGLTGDGGPAVRAEIDAPTSLVATPGGTLYFTQAGRDRAPSSGGMRNSVIREITRAGTIRTVAGLRPRCLPGPARSIPAQSALFDGASLSLSPNGALAVDALLCIGEIHARGLGPDLLLTSSGRFVEDASHPLPPVASVDCGSGVPGHGFRAFGCESGGGHPRELLVVRSDGSSAAYPDYRGGEVVRGDGEVVATYDVSLVRVTRSRLVVLLTTRDLARALHVRRSAIADLYAPAVDGRGDVYFVASTLSRAGCRNGIIERTTGGTIRELWASSTSRGNTCA